MKNKIVLNPNNYKVKKKVKQKSTNCSFRRFVASIFFSLYFGSHTYSLYMYNNTNVKVVQPLKLAARVSNPCISEAYLKKVEKIIERNKWAEGNTAFIPNTPFWSSEGPETDLGVFYTQLGSISAIYEAQCQKLEQIVKDIRIEIPEVDEKNISKIEKTLDDDFAKLLLQNKQIAEIVTGADWSTTQRDLSESLVDEETKKVSLPEDIHLMPYLRIFFLVQYASLFFLFLCYFSGVIYLLQRLNLHKIAWKTIISFAPWNIK